MKRNKKEKRTERERKKKFVKSAFKKRTKISRRLLRVRNRKRCALHRAARLSTPNRYQARIFHEERQSFGWYQFVLPLSSVIWWRPDTARSTECNGYLEATPAKNHNGNKAARCLSHRFCFIPRVDNRRYLSCIFNLTDFILDIFLCLLVSTGLPCES